MPPTAAGACTSFEVAVRFGKNLRVYCYLLFDGLYIIITYILNNVRSKGHNVVRAKTYLMPLFAKYSCNSFSNLLYWANSEL